VKSLTIPTLKTGAEIPHSPTGAGFMQRTTVLIDPLDAVKGTAIAAGVAALIAYAQSVWKKAMKADVDAIIATARTEAAASVAASKIEAAAGIAAIRLELKERNDTVDRRISLWEQRASQFVTREAITELKAELKKEMDSMEGRIEKSINRIIDKLDKLSDSRERHS
jgi:hypothetical protein